MEAITANETPAGAAIVALGDAFDWSAAYVGAVWRQSKNSGGALIIHPTMTRDSWSDRIRPVPDHMTAIQWYNERLDGCRRENARRDRATLEVCSLVIMGFIEGRDMYARKLANAIGSHASAHMLAYDSVPSYTEMRNFLIGELDAHPVIAAAVAFRNVEFHNKLARRDRANFYGEPAPESGWL